MTAAEPLISVVIPTHERAELLERSLASLTGQTLPAAQLEVLVVDDGSADGTAAVCERLAEDLPLRRLAIASSGIAAAKNLGLFAAQAPVVLFFDDDDVADPGLLAAHVAAHRAHPEDEVAVLGHTTWAPELERTPVMDYVTDVGQMLFAYRDLEDGQVLDHTYFWGGRSSAKRAFLAQHGSFDQDFTFLEDIELGFRLAAHGLRVVYDASARSLMTRGVTFEEFGRRCVRRGRSLWLFHERHPDAAVGRYGGAGLALEEWPALAPELATITARVAGLEARHAERGGLDEAELAELHELYGRAFRALEARGLFEAATDAAAAAVGPARQRAVAVCPEPVFVIGSPRSGTTALAHALGEHSELWVSGESDVLFYLFGDRFAERAYERAMAVPGFRWLRLEDVGREEFLAHVGLGLNALFTSRSQGRRWVDQTPLYTLIVDTLGELFPGARFLHILRDGRDVVHSMLNFADSIDDPAVAGFLRERVPWATDVRSACEAWSSHVSLAAGFCEEHPDRALVVRHEDLVADPAAEFAEIHRFLGVAEEPGPARLITSSRINSSFGGAAGRAARAPWDAWDEDRRRTFAEVAGPTMRRCGYGVPG